MIRLALYQPEIPQNTGTIFRMGACLGVGIDIIEPCGFGLSDNRLKRAGMDYVEHVDYRRFSDINVVCNGRDRDSLFFMALYQ